MQTIRNSNACLLIWQRRVIARSADVKSILAVGANRGSRRFRITNAPRLVPRRSTQRASVAGAIAVVRVTEASCKCINTLFAYTNGRNSGLQRYVGAAKDEEQ